MPEDKTDIVPAKTAFVPGRLLRLFLSKEKRQALEKVDEHFKAEGPEKWDSFLKQTERKSFAQALQKDPRADDKLKRHVDQMNRLQTGKVMAEIGNYGIIRKRGGGLACTCPDWRYRRSVAPNGEQDCKHIREYKMGQKVASEEETSTPSAIEATALVAGGGLIARKSMPRLTGRRTYYHGTSARLAKKIQEEGLHPSLKGGARGVILDGGFPKEWAEKAYVAGKKWKAQGYAHQRANTYPTEGAPTLLRASLREWGTGPKPEVNPEVVEEFLPWQRRTLSNMVKADPVVALQFERLPESTQKAVFKTSKFLQGLGQERAISHVPAEAIKGSKHYQRLTLGEIGQYARARPGRFATGVAGAVGGAALAATGARMLHHRLTGSSPVAHPNGDSLRADGTAKKASTRERDLRLVGALSGGVAGMRQGGAVGALAGGLAGYHSAPHLEKLYGEALKRHDAEVLRLPLSSAAPGMVGHYAAKGTLKLQKKLEKPKKTTPST